MDKPDWMENTTATEALNAAREQLRVALAPAALDDLTYGQRVAIDRAVEFVVAAAVAETMGRFEPWGTDIERRLSKLEPNRPVDNA